HSPTLSYMLRLLKYLLSAFSIDAQRNCDAVSAYRPLTLVERDRRLVLQPCRAVNTRPFCQLKWAILADNPHHGLKPTVPEKCWRSLSCFTITSRPLCRDACHFARNGKRPCTAVVR